MLHNYHSHTIRCHHARGTDREYVEAAIQRGLKTLGFSDHAPYKFPYKPAVNNQRMEVELINDYADSIRALAKEYQNDIRILCGFELEYYPKYHKQEMEFLNTVNPDYIILGQHFIGEEADGRLTLHASTDQDLIDYVNQVIEGMHTGDFLYVAHPDLAGRVFSQEVRDREYRRLCLEAKKLNMPLELNFLGIRNQRRYPTYNFYKIAGEVGNEIIFGLDVHSPETVIEPNAEKVALHMVKTFGLNLIDRELI